MPRSRGQPNYASRRVLTPRVIRTGNPPGLDHTTTTHYDPLNRADTITDPLSGVVSIGYDERGNEAWLSDPSGNKTQRGYDDAGRKTTETDPLGKVTHYGYDKSGNVLTEVDSSGVRRTYE